jgi:DNA-binding transcriptional LysR family regulator
MFEELFSKQGLSMDRLRNFLLVVEKGSIAEAADREPSRQSLMSRQIRELEAFFEVELTRRKGKTIEVTDEGKELAILARRCFSQLEDYKLRKSGERPVLRVGAGFSTMQWVITPHTVGLANLLSAELEMVQMRSRATEGLLRTGEIDLAVVRNDAISESNGKLIILPIGGSGYSLFGATNTKLPLAVPTGGGQFAQTVIEAVGDQYPDRIHCESLLQMASLVASEQACSILPDIAEAGYKRMDWVKKTPFPAIKHYRREWVLVANKRQMEARGIDMGKIAKLAEILKIQ